MSGFGWGGNTPESAIGHQHPDDDESWRATCPECLDEDDVLVDESTATDKEHYCRSCGVHFNDKGERTYSEINEDQHDR